MQYHNYLGDQLLDKIRQKHDRQLEILNRSKKFLLKKLNANATVDQFKLIIEDDKEPPAPVIVCHKDEDNLEFDEVIIHLEERMNEQVASLITVFGRYDSNQKVAIKSET